MKANQDTKRKIIFLEFSVVLWSVHWTPSRITRVLVLAGARRYALETCGKKKMRAPLLGLAKSIYYYDNIP